MTGHSTEYDPERRIKAALPLDRLSHTRLLRAALSWTDPTALPPDDYEQVALLLTEASHAVATDLRHHMDRLPPDDNRRALTETVLNEVDRRPMQPSRNTLHGVQNLARLLRDLYERLDRLRDTAPAARAVSH
ncbi:restriction endonuclease [Streptomyces mauvecolor]|uniref:Restriction endonuclease n=1 Tax=Streptomyces mauvecolor TaxID=58345 RepID=A0ABV9UL30_9ACTN